MNIIYPYGKKKTKGKTIKIFKTSETLSNYLFAGYIYIYNFIKKIYI